MKKLLSPGVELTLSQRGKSVVGTTSSAARVFTPADVGVGPDPADDLLVQFFLSGGVEYRYAYRVGYSNAAAIELQNRVLRLAPAGPDGLTGGRLFNAWVRGRCISKELA